MPLCDWGSQAASSTAVQQVRRSPFFGCCVIRLYPTLRGYEGSHGFREDRLSVPNADNGIAAAAGLRLLRLHVYTKSIVAVAVGVIAGESVVD